MTTLDDLRKTYPLPESCREVESFHDVFQAGARRIPLVGLACQLGERTVTASAGGARAERRAYFELVERTSILSAEASGATEFPTIDPRGRASVPAKFEEVFPPPQTSTSRPAKSNGIAVHSSARGAATRALDETLERDRVLRSWFGGPPPERIDRKVPFEQTCASKYELRAYRFEPVAGRETVGVFWFPKSANDPLAYGFACRRSTREALAAASAESIQRVGFLTGERLPEAKPERTPTADFHQEWFLYPPHRVFLEDWLAGKGDRGKRLTPPRPSEARYADITPPELRGRVYVMKALVPEALGLHFGAHTPYATCATEELLTHPIA